MGAATLRTAGIQRVSGVHDGADAAARLRVGDDGLGERRLARALRPVELGAAAGRNAADAEGEIERDGAGRNGLDLHMRTMFAEFHNSSLAKAPLDLRDRQVERLLALARAGPVGEGSGGVAAPVCWHASSPVLPSPLHWHSGNGVVGLCVRLCGMCREGNARHGDAESWTPALQLYVLSP